jgi:hypothetical protein
MHAAITTIVARTVTSFVTTDSFKLAALKTVDSKLEAIAPSTVDIAIVCGPDTLELLESSRLWSEDELDNNGHRQVVDSLDNRIALQELVPKESKSALSSVHTLEYSIAGHLLTTFPVNSPEQETFN